MVCAKLEKEVEFILEELDLEPGDHILDVGCGAGRHAIELAKTRIPRHRDRLFNGYVDRSQESGSESWS